MRGGEKGGTAPRLSSGRWPGGGEWQAHQLDENGTEKSCLGQSTTLAAAAKNVPLLQAKAEQTRGRSRNVLFGFGGRGSGDRVEGEVTHLPQPVVMAQLEIQGGCSLPTTTQELLPPPHVLLSQIEVAEL